ncbi:hypothetical protein KBZ18_16145 [Synechococcus sp. Cruz-9H2]|uniref:hypothetical protein n=3 Tax=Synechococcus TaxID=1129 RepID=UPI0020CC308C|nr:MULTISPECIES: hypothetical protein [unclassified Synechococcus]MCP9821011.1 hypothetical protein [Synechococcus sp. Cruz-9H2]MCP9845248.1 hypothetical protein [Synechococcus sp. Edmonson 11F2]MCP9857419.1 hypothetical protein [Synechococcus sp. Cruz-9C9]MCP9864660.1 hypothetical protein [Synechococcus sp. Cruz-7E5]
MNNRIEDLHPVELLMLAVLLVAEALVLIAVPLIALVLTLTSWRGSATSPPTTAPAVPVVAPVAPAAVPVTAPAPPTTEQPWLPPIWQELERLTVAELRRLARAEGLPRSLSRAGRRAELLPALAGAAMAW